MFMWLFLVSVCVGVGRIRTCGSISDDHLCFYFPIHNSNVCKLLTGHQRQWRSGYYPCHLSQVSLVQNPAVPKVIIKYICGLKKCSRE